MNRDYEGGSDARFDTLAVREGQHRGAEGEHNDPLFLTSSFTFRSAAEAAARFAETEPGNVYSRFTNPTVRTFEERLAALEGGARCVATASGMGAILTLGLALLKAGDHVVVSRNVFGATITLFNTVFARFGVDVSYVDLVDLDQWHDAMRPETRLAMLESPSNPLGEVVDIRQVAGIAHERGACLAVDNVMCTPVLQRPLELGADVVVHSATKYLDGQGRCVGGAIVTNDDSVRDAAYKIMRSAGPSMSPFNAWVFLKGLETLRLRMQAHCANALTVARWLEMHPAVARVHYLGLERHPQHALARRQQKGFGGIVSFEVRGGREEAWQVLDHTRWLSITANLGDAKTTVTHPASTTHGRISAKERAAAGVNDALIRVSVGLEDPEDIKADLGRGLDALSRAPRLRCLAGG